jgi:hypothetical protein
MRHLWPFIRAPGRHWWALGGGFFALFTGIIPGLRHKEVAPSVWAVALLIAVLPASFFAWREERRRVERLHSIPLSGARTFHRPQSLLGGMSMSYGKGASGLRAIEGRSCGITQAT